MLTTLPAVQSFEVINPTETTVQFTVSTRRRGQGFASHVFAYIKVAVRILLGASISLLLFVKWSHDRNTIPRWLSRFTALEAGIGLVEQMEWMYLIPISIVGLWLAVRKGYVEESLLVLRGLGVQTTTSSSTYLTTPTSRFIPTTAIQDIFLHEAFKGFEVRFYLSIVVEDEEDAVVVFPVSPT
ncbi:hypothetical protein P152DRAFT_320665 [Eremomyces bilateralis CBS 781.70]|uniref:Phosphatidylinositol N-acetylglucosaminyltransferase subunit H conserved domain-containing protein n=1 Tax=Eremomyces bilateralis CBS 781.70 TaxID=1392243 RepID=A0A6G1G5T9_9PEZI|nr:uncharacterized protein P152DRAFT_320665 [Eremomyces bilateralis CBS 781.70]KAF1813465.1 hypothetical protein P152DRAFT_320665 [Eremomyces bilateralis CBS 781.70]